MTAIQDPDLVETVVRFHDAARLDELGRALFSLVGQSYRPLRVMVITQRFDAAAQAAVEARVALYRRLDPGITLEVLPYRRTSGLADAKAALMNTAIAAARGRCADWMTPARSRISSPPAAPNWCCMATTTGRACIICRVRGEKFPSWGSLPPRRRPQRISPAPPITCFR